MKVKNWFLTVLIHTALTKNSKAPEITKAFLSDWMERSETEGSFNHGKRISCVRQLLVFMATCGINVYIPHDFAISKGPCLIYLK